MSAIAVLGAGSWGSALAVHLARTGREVRLWARNPALVEEMTAARTNAQYLRGVPLPDGIMATAELPAALDGAAFVVVAVPSHGLRMVVRAALPFVRDGAVFVSAAKGLEADSLRRMSQVIDDETRGAAAVAVLSGPSFASELARELPTAVLVASERDGVASVVQEHFRGRSLRLYASDDVAGVEIGGALKNVIAIAAGVVEGLGLGHNAMAALITRGLAEMSRLACAVGGRRETLAGLSGLGDLVLTCTSDLSRNHHVGVQLGRGQSLPEILAGMHMVAEGVRTTDAALALGGRHGVELPITAQMAAVLHGTVPPLRAVETLMGRRQRLEADE